MSKYILKFWVLEHVLREKKEFYQPATYCLPLLIVQSSPTG